MSELHDRMSSGDRAIAVNHYIDPGFVNERLVETVVGQVGADEINRLVGLVPAVTPEWQLRTRHNHIYTRVALAFCSAIKAPGLREVLAARRGTIVCSTETFAACPDVYSKERVQISVIMDETHDLRPEFHLSTRHITSDTTRMELDRGGLQSFIATVRGIDGNRLILHPLIIGSPWLETDNPTWKQNIVWFGREFYEHFIEDIDQFTRVRDVAQEADFEIMQRITERAFKTCLGEILGDTTSKDWGGEQSDHYTAHISITGKRLTGAFLLKGPARFVPMTLNNLGKNNDQIVRLAHEPADLLVVQHCHDITPPVRETLRAFAVQPSRPRRYCLIDGRDSLRLLRAYDKLDRALALSQTGA